MKWISCNKSAEQKAYLKFVKENYKNDPNYIDYMTPIINEVFQGKSPFAQNLWFEAYLIQENEQIIGVVTYLIHANYKRVLQIAFLEYSEREGLSQQIFIKAKQLAEEKNISEIIVGLNGHVNYGLGLSLEQMHRPTFGSVYTKSYYSRDFKALNFVETKLVSFQYPWETKTFPITDERRKQFHDHFEFRTMDKSSFINDIKHYTDLNNKCFKDHPFYYLRTEAEDRFLFKDLKFFLEKGSLIFAEDNGNPIGFLLWYPDWGELMKPGETLSVSTFLKRCIHHKKVKCFKIVEWAVLPEYRRKDVPIGLLAHCYQQVVLKDYTQCKTSWIVEDNKDSSSFGLKWATPYEHYAVYSMKLK